MDTSSCFFAEIPRYVVLLPLLELVVLTAIVVASRYAKICVAIAWVTLRPLWHRK